MTQPVKTRASAARQAEAAVQSESQQLGRVRDSAHNRGPKPWPLIGNQAALQALGAGRMPRGVLQTKLAINEPGDVFEQEADRVADSVMRMPSAGTFSAGIVEGGSSGEVQRACACGGTCGDCQEKAETLQRAAESSSATARTAPPIVDEVLSSPGRKLDSHTRAFMEPRFGADLSGVRVHTDSRAAESAHAVNALAYTVGDHIVFGGSQYSPGTTSGRKLFAHELTHVLQQSGAVTHPETASGTEASVETLRRAPADPEATPYLPTALSREYWRLSAAERAAINTETDAEFRKETGAVQKLDPHSKEDNPLRRRWLRIRDRVTQARLHGEQPAKAEGASPEPPKKITIDIVDEGKTHKVEPPKDEPKKQTKPDEPPKKDSSEDTPKSEKPEEEPLFQMTSQMAGQYSVRLAGTPHPSGPCDYGNLQVGAKYNWKGLPLGSRVTLFSEPELDVDFAPAFCKDSPGLMLQDNFVKVEISKEILEAVLQGGVGFPGGAYHKSGYTQVTGTAALELDVKPWGRHEGHWYKNVKFFANMGVVWTRKQHLTDADEWTLNWQTGVGYELP